MMMTMMMMVTKKTMMMTQVIDHEEDNLSDKETYSKNIPAIGGINAMQCYILNYAKILNMLYSFQYSNIGYYL